MWKILKRGLATRLVSPSFGNYVQVSEEVSEALRAGQGVVALESTIITHGLPYPHNLSTAFSVEKKIRDCGSIPATVAVLDGQLRVGLKENELLWLAEKNSQLIKISRRDLSYVISQKLSGGTTVSGTMIAAHLAGINVFATGGIGGVHRGAEASFDISADLTELGRTPVAVVASGVKSILDIPKTLEVLETQGVFVSSFGDSKDFPAFFTPKSGSTAPYNSPTVYEAAQVIDTQLGIGLSSGMLFAVPVPEELAACGETIEEAVSIAVREAQKQNVSGKAVTPFILGEVNRLTGGDSLQANVALVENNATIAGAIARCLSLIQQGLSRDEIFADSFVHGHSPSSSSSHSLSTVIDHNSQRNKKSSSSSQENACHGRPIVIGATIMDLILQIKNKDFQMNGATYPGKVSQSFGGVGRNLADCLTRMEANPLFVSAVGDDSHSASLYTACKHMDLSAVVKIKSESTATYSPILNSSGHLLFGVGDMDINAYTSPDQMSHVESALKQAPIVIMDGNFSSQVIGHVVDICYEASVPVWYEPTDINKASKPFESDAWKQITLTSPNMAELRMMWKALKTHQGQLQDIDNYSASEKPDTLSELINESLKICRNLVSWIPVVIVTLGHHGALVCHAYGSGSCISLKELSQRPQAGVFQALYYPAVTDKMEEPNISSVSGAGDCLSGAVIAGLLDGHSLDSSMKQGMLAATMSLYSKEAVPDSINPVNVSQEIAEGWGWHNGQEVTHGWQSFNDIDS